MSTRGSRHFVDGEVTILHPYARLVLRGVPAGSSFGAVMVPKTGDQWYTPYPHLVGEHRQGRMVQWDSSRHVYFQTYAARHRGTAVIEGRAQFTEPVGGFVVLPRWIYR